MMVTKVANSVFSVIAVGGTDKNYNSGLEQEAVAYFENGGYDTGSRK